MAKKTSIHGVIIIEPKVFGDHRGFFLETYSSNRYQQMGVEGTFVQDNHSHSSYGILRGLHYQLHHAQAKLMYVIKGEIFDVAVDIRQGSPTFGKWAGAHLSSENHKQMYIPQGFAHGFCVLSEKADILYKCTDVYHPEDEYGVLWSDPNIDIDWPIRDPILSKKDSAYPQLKGIPEDCLPVFTECRS